MRLNEPIRFVLIVLMVTMAFITLQPNSVAAQPVVIGQPADTSVCNGGRASFFVLAVNTVAYHWQENDGVGWYNIDESITYAEGYTTSVLTINDANLGLNGYFYRCVVTDGDNNSVLSDSATLGVNEPPVITMHPSDITVCKNEIAVFSTSALYADSYQWQESVGAGWIDIANNAFYSGVTEPELLIFTTTGMNGFRYRCRMVNGNCPDTSQFAMLFVNPTPTLQTVVGGGSFCAGGAGLPVGMADSEAGIAYHMYRNGNSTGVVISGTGEAITFGNFQQAGTYSVIAINGSTSCEIPMLNSVEIVVNPLPLQQLLMGGGSFCEGSDAPEVFLASSQQGVQYELFKNGISTTQILSGTGFTLSFGHISETGFYTVTAKNSATGCAVQMNGNVQVIKYALPQVFAGEDQIIAQGNAATLTAQVSGSSTYLYQWQPGAYVQQPQQANTQTIPLYQSRIFTVDVKDLISQCHSPADSLKVTVTGGPLVADLSADATNVCPGTQVAIVANASGGTGNYIYSWTSDPPGFTSNQSQISVMPEQSTTYSLLLNDGNTSISKSITIFVYPLPQVFEVTGGGNHCAGTEGLLVGLSNTQNGHSYELYRNGQFVLSKTGSGSVLDFGSFTEAGTYTSNATNSSGGCSAAMNGSATIISWQKPVAEAGPEQLIGNGETALLHGSATGGSGNYQWMWTPVDYLINPNSANAATVPLSTTRQFQLKVTDQNSLCQSNSDQTVVFVSGTPALQLDATASAYNICPEEEVQLTALASGGSGNYSYSWTSVPEGLNSTAYNPIVNPIITTTYVVTVSDGFLSASDQFTVVVRPTPLPFQVQGGGNYCSGDQGPEVRLADSESNVFYSLLLNGTETGTLRQGTGDPITFSFQQTAGIYQVKAFSPISLCPAEMTGSVNVSVSERPVASAGNDISIPYNGTTLLAVSASGGSGNYSALWSPSGMVSQPTALQTNTLPLTATTNFTVRITDQQNGCQSIPDTKTVFVSGTVMTVQVNASSNSICLGSNLELQAMTTGGTGSYTYYWTSEPEGFYGNTANIIVSPSVTTIYKVEVSDGLQILQSQKQIAVDPIPALYVVTGGGNLCNPGSQLPVGLSGSEAGIQYDLLYENTNTGTLVGNGSAISFGLYNGSGSYAVQAINTSNGCSSEMAGAAVITSSGQVIADAGPDKTVVSGGQTVLEGNVIAQNPAYTYFWTPANKLLNSQALQPTTVGLTETTVFKLVASSQGGGCLPSEDYVTVFLSGTAISINIQSGVQSVCPGDPVQLIALVSGGSGNYSYSWTSTPAGQTSGEYNPVFFPGITTTFFLTVSDGVQSQTSSITIDVKNAPQSFSFQGGGLYCTSTAVEPFVLSGSENGVNYSLYRNGIQTPQMLSGNGGSLIFGNIQQTGAYTVLAETAGQCQTLMPGIAEVDFRAPLVAVASPDQTVVSGSDALLTVQTGGGSGDYSYQWNPASLVQNPNASTTNTVALFNSTAFNVVVQDNETGCISMADTSLVLVSGIALNAGILAPVTSICNGSQLTFTALPEGGSGNYSFIWKDPAGAVIGTNAMLTFTATLEGLYTLTVIDGAEAATATQAIEILAVPELFTTSGGGYLCQNQNGQNIMLSGSQTSTEYSLIYNNTQTTAILFGTGSPLLFQNNLQTGTYTVRAKNLNNSCSVNMLSQAELIATEPIAVNLQDIQTIITGQTAQLSVEVSGGSGTFYYQWQPSALVSNPNLPSTSTLPLSSNMAFQLAVTDAVTNCIASGQTFVLVNNTTLNLEIFAESQIVCPGEPVQLFALATGGNGAVSYNWSSSPEGFTSTVYNPVVSPGTNTTYHVTVSDGISQLTKSVQVMVKQQPQSFIVSGGGNSCDGTSSVEISLSGSEVGAIYTLLKNEVSTSLVLNGTGQPLQFSQISAEGSYTVQAKLNSTSCNNIMTGQAGIQNYETPFAASGPDQTILTGNTAVLTAVVSGGSTFYNSFWNPSYLTQAPAALNTTTLPLNQSQLFYFYANDQQSGCISNVDTTLVIVTGGQLAVTILPDQASVCAGSSVLLTAIPSGGTGNYSFTWTDSNGQLIGQEQQISYLPTASGFVYILLQDAGFSQRDSAHIEAIELPQSFTVTGGGTLCQTNQGVAIGLEDSQQSVQYKLIKDYQHILMDIAGTGEAIDFGLFTQPGVYTVEARVSGEGCSISMTGSALIQQYDAPVAEANPYITINIGESTQLSSQVFGGSGNYTYHWFPGEHLLNPNSPDPLTKTLTASVMFTLEVTDTQTGCTAQAQTFVYVSGNSLSVSINTTANQVCPGVEVEVNALPDGGSGIYSWTWTTKPSSETGTNAVFRFSPTVSTWVKVTISDGIANIADSVLIQTYTLPQTFELTGGGNWCQDSAPPSFQLTGSEYGVYYSLFRNGYYTGISLTGNGQPLTWATASANGTYTVLAQGAGNCNRSMNGNVEMQQLPLPVIHQFSGGGSWCFGEEDHGIFLSGTEAGVQYQIMYNGSEPAGSFAGTGLPVSLPSPQISGIYTVSATSQGTECITLMNGTASVLIYPLPLAEIEGPNESCEGETIRLQAGGGDTYTWLTEPWIYTDFIDIQCFESKEYRLVTTNSFGCSDTAYHNLIVNALPQFTVRDEADQLKIVIEPEEFYPVYRFWSGEQLLSEGPEMEYEYGITVFPNDTIDIEVENIYGCKERGFIVISSYENEIPINAFSPNSDNINDKFLKGNFIKVFNRWGLQLYSGFEGWDGRYNGAVVAPGTYYYIMELRDLNGSVVRTEKGSVTIVTE